MDQQYAPSQQYADLTPSDVHLDYVHLTPSAPPVSTPQHSHPGLLAASSTQHRTPNCPYSTAPPCQPCWYFHSMVSRFLQACEPFPALLRPRFVWEGGVRKAEVVHSRWQRIFRCFVPLRCCQDYPARLQPRSSPTIGGSAPEEELQSALGETACPHRLLPTPQACLVSSHPQSAAFRLLFCPRLSPHSPFPRTGHARRSWE